MLLLVSLLLVQEIVIGSFEFDGQECDFWLWVLFFFFDGVCFLVFNFYGFGFNVFQQEVYVQMNFVVDIVGFYVCYFNGISNVWNVGWIFGSIVDDVGFISVLIDIFVGQYLIDLEWIYVCGMFNGGFMSYCLACEFNDCIVVVVLVIGSMVLVYVSECVFGWLVLVLEIYGIEDVIVFYEGQFLLVIFIEEFLVFWNVNNSCDGDVVIFELFNINSIDVFIVLFIEFEGCVDWGDVWYYCINGGGYIWLGLFFVIGVINQDINGSVEIWYFFFWYIVSGFFFLVDYFEFVWLVFFFNLICGQVEVIFFELGGEFMVVNVVGWLVICQFIEDCYVMFDLFVLFMGVYWVRVWQGGVVSIGQLFW